VPRVCAVLNYLRPYNICCLALAVYMTARDDGCSTASNYQTDVTTGIHLLQQYGHLNGARIYHAMKTGTFSSTALIGRSIIMQICWPVNCHWLQCILHSEYARMLNQFSFVYVILYVFSFACYMTTRTSYWSELSCRAACCLFVLCVDDIVTDC
jgi:hypothetical protein